MNDQMLLNPERTRQHTLYEQWQDALLSPRFDADQLQAIHAEYQAKLQREAEWKRLWDECDRQWRAENAAIEQRIREIWASASKHAVFERYKTFVRFVTLDDEMRSYRLWTKEDVLRMLVDHEQRGVRGVAQRTRARWNEQHPDAPAK